MSRVRLSTKAAIQRSMPCWLEDAIIVASGCWHQIPSLLPENELGIPMTKGTVSLYKRPGVTKSRTLVNRSRIHAHTVLAIVMWCRCYMSIYSARTGSPDWLRNKIDRVHIQYVLVKPIHSHYMATFSLSRFTIGTWLSWFWLWLWWIWWFCQHTPQLRESGEIWRQQRYQIGRTLQTHGE